MERILFYATSQANEYTYDKNGNLTKDLNKKISLIQYNLLNLPTSITYSNGKSATYIYDANGNKLKTTEIIRDHQRSGGQVIDLFLNQ